MKQFIILILILLTGTQCLAIDSAIPLNCIINSNIKVSGYHNVTSFLSVQSSPVSDEFNLTEELNIIITPDLQVLFMDGKPSAYQIKQINDYQILLSLQNKNTKNGEDKRYGKGSETATFKEDLTINRMTGLVSGFAKTETVGNYRSVNYNYYYEVTKSGYCQPYSGKKQF